MSLRAAGLLRRGGVGQLAQGVQPLQAFHDVILRNAKVNEACQFIHAQGARQLFKGGVIRPVRKRLLVFAIAPESYGKTMVEMGYRPQRAGGNPAANKRIRALFGMLLLACAATATAAEIGHRDIFAVPG